MRPARFPSLGLRDPAFYQGTVVGEPDPADPALWAWYRGDKYATEAPPAGEPQYPFTVSAWGNASNATVDKTNVTQSRNLTYRRDVMRVWPPCFTRTDQLENIIGSSESMLFGASGNGWFSVLCTRDDATHATFTGANGIVYWATPYLLPNHTYKLTITARNVSGNANIEVYHAGSGTGTAQALALTGSLADYTYSFVGREPPTNIVNVGLRDPNGAGWGQVEVTKWHLRRSDMSDTYLAVSASQQPRMGTVFPGHRCVFCGPHGYARVHNIMSLADDPITLPMTFHFVAYWPQYSTGQWVFAADPPDTWDAATIIDPPINMYGNASGVRLPLNNPQPVANTPYILTCGFQNGVTTYFRKNLEAANSGLNVQCGPSIKRGFTWGGENNLSGSAARSVYFPEIIMYEGTRTAQQETDTINYLATRYGISV